MEEYNIDNAIKIMREALPQDEQSKYDDDQLINLIDIIWDFYEQNGLLDIDASDDDDDDDILSDLIDYAKRMLKKDKGAIIKSEHVEPLIKAEISYEDSIIG